MLVGSLSLSPTVAAVVWTLIALFGALGLLAVISPKWFGSLAQIGNRWVDTSRFLAKLDRPIDVDARITPHARWLGAAVVLSVGFLAFVLAR